MDSSRSGKCLSANFMNGQVLAFSTFLFGLLETPISSLAIQPPHRRSDATDQQHHLRPPHFQPPLEPNPCHVVLPTSPVSGSFLSEKVQLISVPLNDQPLLDSVPDSVPRVSGPMATPVGGKRLGLLASSPGFGWHTYWFAHAITTRTNTPLAPPSLFCPTASTALAVTAGAAPVQPLS